jgi:hypothetical protein
MIKKVTLAKEISDHPLDKIFEGIPTRSPLSRFVEAARYQIL